VDFAAQHGATATLRSREVDSREPPLVSVDAVH